MHKKIKFSIIIIFNIFLFYTLDFSFLFDTANGLVKK